MFFDNKKVGGGGVDSSSKTTKNINFANCSIVPSKLNRTIHNKNGYKIKYQNIGIQPPYAFCRMWNSKLSTSQKGAKFEVSYKLCLNKASILKTANEQGAYSLLSINLEQGGAR